MTVLLNNMESICDLQGNPLNPKSMILIKALDRMLTVGSYYSPQHEQYIKASENACEEIVGTLGAANQSTTIEITAQGLMVGGQNVDPQHRNVRLLHELLVPLNIARLEISGFLTPEDLRGAISILQERRMDLGQSNSFKEIIFDNLPASIKTVSCSVLQKSADQLDADSVTLNDLLGKWDDHDFSLGQSDSISVSDKLASQFMDMVTQILKNIDKFEKASGGNELSKADGSYVTKDDLVSLREALQRLVDVNPDPAELTKLITQAQRALHLSQDAQSVNLAFSILKKDIMKKSSGTKPQTQTKSPKFEFKLTVEDLLNTVEELEKSPALVVDPWDGARTDQLVISLQLLRSDPPLSQRMGMIEVITNAMARNDFYEHNLFVCTRYFNTIAREDGAQGLEKMLPLVLEPLRHKRCEMVAPFWAHLLELIDEEQLPHLWPYLVNDILLGFEGAPRKTVKKLVLAAGNISVEVAQGLEPTLARQPSLQGNTGGRDLFTVPLINLYPVHAMLANSPLKAWLGLEIHRALCAKPESVLVEVVMSALGGYNPEYISFYLDLIRHQDNQDYSEDMRGMAVDIIQGALASSSSERRSESWIPLGLMELGKLDQVSARPLLERIVKERKFLFFKAWPAPVRQAAEKILLADFREVK